MNLAAHAHHWGIKAAMAELPITSNPYRTQQTRAAWLAGYQQASAGTERRGDQARSAL